MFYLLDIEHGADYSDNKHSVCTERIPGPRELLATYLFRPAGISGWCRSHSAGAHNRILAHSVSHPEVQHPTSTETCF